MSRSTVSARLRAVALALLPAACGADHGHDHGGSDGHHAHVAPHGGVLVPLGGEAVHVELLLERDPPALTVWLLDGEAERALRSAQPALEVELAGAAGPLALRLEAVPSTLTGETVGDTSEFRAVDPALAGARLEGGRILRIEVLGLAFDDVAIEPED